MRAIAYSSLKHSCWHVLTRDQTVWSTTHTFIRKWNQPPCLYSPAQSISPQSSRYSFPSRWEEEAELVWGVRRNTEVVFPPEDGHPSQYQPRRPWTELTTIESQVQRHNH